MNAKISFKRVAVVAAAVGLSTAALASPVGVDGSLGAEWTGVTAVTMGYDPGAPTSNFGSPGTTNHIVGYDVYYRADANYLYGAIKANGSTTGLNFANLYFNTNLTGGSDFGIEVTNNQAFVPGFAGYYDIASYLTWAASAADVDHVLEFALDWSYFTSNPDGIIVAGTNVANGIQLRSIQAYGYSVTGGDLAGGTRFGTVAQPQPTSVPEPTTALLAGAALMLAGAARRRSSRR